MSSEETKNPIAELSVAAVGTLIILLFGGAVLRTGWNLGIAGAAEALGYQIGSIEYRTALALFLVLWLYHKVVKVDNA